MPAAISDRRRTRRQNCVGVRSEPEHVLQMGPGVSKKKLVNNVYITDQLIVLLTLF